MARLWLDFSKRCQEDYTRVEYAFKIFNQALNKAILSQKPVYVEGFMYYNDIQRIQQVIGLDPFLITSSLIKLQLDVIYEITPETILLFRK